MANQSSDIGVLTALANRLVDQRLPRVLAMKEKVDGGEVLDDAELAFLEKVFAEAGKVAPIVERNPKYLDVATRMASLYKEITAKALENEQAKQG